MFGYVRAAVPELKIKEHVRYRAYYCGVCKAMAAYTALGRSLLSFDIAFYALLTDWRAGVEIAPRLCLLKLKKTPCARGPEIDYAAALNVLLAAGKARDDLSDGEKRRRAAVLLLRRAEKRAGRAVPAAAEMIRTHLQRLSELERANCAHMDEIADVFAKLCAGLCACAPGIPEEDSVRRVVESIGYHVARWVYLIDAFDDLERDGRKGVYNPVAQEIARRGLPQEEIIPWIRQTLYASLNDARLAAELLPESLNKPILQNIILYGLSDKTEEIMAKKEKKHGSV